MTLTNSTDGSGTTSLLGMSVDELRVLVQAYGAPRFRGDQIADWLYRRKVESIDSMSNIPIPLREILAARHSLGRNPPDSVSVSSDGTKKYLFGLPIGEGRSAIDRRLVEAAYIPEVSRATLCLSSQVGCAMGCLFCMTGKQGLQGNLSAAEIVNQYMSLPERDSITNIVYMGMGEPLDNPEEVLRSLKLFTDAIGISQKRITVSTIGIVPGLRRFISESRCRLAISVHTPFDDERKRLMPMQHVYPIGEVMEIVRRSDFGKQRRVSLEYIVFQGLNHGSRHAREIARLTEGIRCRINLIRFHEIPGSPLKTATEAEMVDFESALRAKGLRTTIRASRGEDVQAACGMLSTKRLSQVASEEEIDY